MLGAPALLLFGSGITMFLNNYQDTVARAVALDASRYAALADQDLVSARGYLDRQLARMLPKLQVQSSVQIDKVATVGIEYRPLPTLFNIAGQRVSIRVGTPVETNG